MIDIAETLIATVRDDASVKALTGATDTDTRVYAYYEADA